MPVSPPTISPCTVVKLMLHVALLCHFADQRSAVHDQGERQGQVFARGGAYGGCCQTDQGRG